MTKTERATTPWSVFPLFIWFGLFLIVPLLIVLVLSFLQRGDYGKVEYVFNSGNYVRAFEPLYLKILGRSLALAGGTTLACLLISYPVSYAMARMGVGMRKVLLGLVIVPFWTNFVIRVYGLKLVLGENGFINQLLTRMGLISQPLMLTDNFFGMSVGMVYNFLPFMILPLFVALEKLDFLLLDAAYDLGATRAQMLWRVLLPLSLPGIVTGSLFVFIPALGEFVIPDLLGGSQNMYVGTLITETFLKTRDWPFGSALSSFLVAAALVAFAIVLRPSAEELKEARK
jgi:spermidine/putrescine transport system permease protein